LKSLILEERAAKPAFSMRSVYVDGDTGRRKEGLAASGHSGLVGDAGQGLRHGLVKDFRVDCWNRCV
jgi:hypothetical protein